MKTLKAQKQNRTLRSKRTAKIKKIKKLYFFNKLFEFYAYEIHSIGLENAISNKVRLRLK